MAHRSCRLQVSWLTYSAHPEELHGGSIEAVTELAASSIKGVSRRSALGRFVGSSTIAEVANTTRKAFVTDAVSGGVQAKRAGELWDTIRKIVKTVRPDG